MDGETNCVKTVRIQSFSGRIFPHIFCSSPDSVRMRKNTDQKNSECGHFSHSDKEEFLGKKNNTE